MFEKHDSEWVRISAHGDRSHLIERAKELMGNTVFGVVGSKRDNVNKIL